jgi:hypothetical protein
MAVPVDDDRSGHASTTLELGDGPTLVDDGRVEHGRCPPIGVQVGQGGAGFGGHDQAITNVVGGRQRLDVVADEVSDHVPVPFEATAGQDHAPAGSEEHVVAVVLGPHPDDGAVG